MRSALAILMFVSIVTWWGWGPDPTLRHWELGLVTTDADLSPDDRLLAITLESPPAPQKAREPIVESVQVWDYRQKAKIGDIRLATYLNIKPTPNVIRFSADGLLLVATDPTRLHVLEAAGLNLIRVIEPPLKEKFRIDGLETSPAGHFAVVAAGDGLTTGVLFAYDLDSGRLLFQWEAPHAVRSISWSGGGTQFAVAAPFPCTRFRDTIHVFSVNPWAHMQTLSARNPTSVAFSEDRLYFVESSFCKGSMLDRHLGLEAFDIHSWDRQPTTFLQHRDIHSFVSFQKGKLLADTGEVSIKHDWMDATTWGVDRDVQLTVWDGDAQSILFSSAPIETSRHVVDSPENRVRLSRSGKLVLLDNGNPQVFEIP